MTYQVLARKWRPHNFLEVVGQEHVVKSLVNALQFDRLHHAYLFTGTRGVGKTTLARILAKAINCENLENYNPCGRCEICQSVDEGRFLDLIEVDAASRTKVEDTRDLLDNVQYAPNRGRYKIYLIDEVHMLSGHSFNALLKTLEEPPGHVKFLLATTDPHKIPVTVLSRCLQLNLKRLLPEQIFKQMELILNQEGIDYDKTALDTLARAADGSMRDGLSLLDQAIVHGNGQITDDSVYTMLGTVAKQPVYDLLHALSQLNGAAVLEQVRELAALTPDFGDILKQLLQTLHRVALNQQFPELIDPDLDHHAISELAAALSAEDLQLYYQIALIGQRDLDWAPDPQTGFEMIMLRMLAFRPKSSQPASNNPDPKQSRINNNDGITSLKLSDSGTGAKHSRDLQWPDMITAMRLSGLTRELANNCVLASIDDQACRIILDSGHEHLRRPNNEKKLQDSLRQYLGKPLNLVITVAKTDTETPALLHSKALENKQLAAEEAILADDNIQALKEHFDARVMPGSIEPV